MIEAIGTWDHYETKLFYIKLVVQGESAFRKRKTKEQEVGRRSSAMTSDISRTSLPGLHEEEKESEASCSFGSDEESD